MPIPIYNHSALKSRRRQLRSEQTNAERLLWSKLRNRQLLEIKFFRQYSVGPFILDFYAPTLRLGIELDGGQHAQPVHNEYDRRRTAYLDQQHITVIRFWNNDVLTNLTGVLETVAAVFTRNPSPPPLILRGGGSNQPTESPDLPS